MKKVFLGLVLGLTISCFAVVFAEEFVAERASFPILVNGQEFKTDKPIVTINGSTYLPLRAIGEALGVRINWNEEKKQAEVGEPTPVNNNKFSFKNPGNIGETQVILTNDGDAVEKYSVTLSEAKRGDDAFLYLKNNYAYQTMTLENPDQGYEYLLAKFNFKALKLKTDTSYNLSCSDFKMIAGNGNEYSSNIYLRIKDDLRIDGNLYEESERNGWIVYQVKKDDLKPRIAYGRSYDGSGGAWFKAYKD